MTRPAAAAQDWLGRTFTVQIDRPLGTAHPRHPDIIYPVNYGFIPGTLAADGGEVDAYVLGPNQPLTRTRGRCIAILHRRDDVEDKLVIHVGPSAPPQPDAIRAATSFQERFFDTTLIMAPLP